MLVATLTSLGKTVSLIVAISFIAWAIVTAIFVPKRSAGFPRRLDAYILVSAVLFLAQMTTVVWAAQTQEVEKESAGEAAPPGGGGGDHSHDSDDPHGAVGRRDRRQAGVRDGGLHVVSHARRRRRDGHRRAEPRPGEASRRRSSSTASPTARASCRRSRASSRSSRSRTSRRTSRRSPAPRKHSVRRCGWTPLRSGRLPDEDPARASRTGSNEEGVS